MARYGRRRWRRRRRYFRRRIPKAIGTSSRNMLKLRVNVEQSYVVHFTQGKTYADQILMDTPYCSAMITTPCTVGLEDMDLLAGIYKSESARKILTLYQEMKCDGMYCQVNVAPSSSYNQIKLYYTWERTADAQSYKKYRTNWPDDPYGKIKANANEQGGRYKVFCPSKGSTAPLFSKCVARSLQEKTNFIQTSTTHTTYAFGPGSYGQTQGYRYHEFWANEWKQGHSPAFEPCFFCIFENDQPTQQGGFNIQVQVKYTYYMTFRNPGVSNMTDDVYELLLKNNDDLIPYDPEADKSVHTAEDQVALATALKPNPCPAISSAEDYTDMKDET